MYMHYFMTLGNYPYAGALGFVDLSQLSSSHVNTVPVNSYGHLHLTDGFKMGDFNVYDIYVSIGRLQFSIINSI